MQQRIYDQMQKLSVQRFYYHQLFSGVNCKAVDSFAVIVSLNTKEIRSRPLWLLQCESSLHTEY